MVFLPQSLETEFNEIKEPYNIGLVIFKQVLSEQTI